MGSLSDTRRPAVWAGVECSLLDLDGWRCDQVELTGHGRRLDDVERLAALGATAVRYPVLWGRSDGADATDWRWADDRLGRLRAHGIRPIVGLLHHGYGPRGIDPLGPDYAARFAGYAQSVARRYPWVDAYVVINEPLTTARFGGLYGWWPPRERDHGIFVRLFVAQCLAYRAAVQAIRQVRPDVTIAVTEDAGRTSGTDPVRRAVDHDNQRRWLTYDTLTGRVDRAHPLWTYLTMVAPSVRHDLEVLAGEPESPDLLGLNRYITSDRFLDHRLERYPKAVHGGGGGLAYADVELVRVDEPQGAGFAGAMREAWQRYRLPLALTEVHLGGETIDQIAWWAEAWRDASAVAADGIPVAAVTAWAVFGAWEWASLLRRRDGYYEAGCFDCRDGTPRATDLARIVARTASSGDPATDASGWWQSAHRVEYGAVGEHAAGGAHHAA